VMPGQISMVGLFSFILGFAGYRFVPRSAKARIEFGVDAFIIRDRRIVLQTVSYELKPAS
jgi:hypothetical protein